MVQSHPLKQYISVNQGVICLCKTIKKNVSKNNVGYWKATGMKFKIFYDRIWIQKTVWCIYFFIIDFMLLMHKI